jgi:hypothetical protein
VSEYQETSEYHLALINIAMFEYLVQSEYQALSEYYAEFEYQTQCLNIKSWLSNGYQEVFEYQAVSE